jgi:hypothetical protein
MSPTRSERASSSLARPGDNATGFIPNTASAKWPELRKEVAPGLTRAAVLAIDILRHRPVVPSRPRRHHSVEVSQST